MSDPKSHQPDWSIDELYKTSWRLVKKHKILWVFGAAAGVASASFNSSFSNFNFNQADLQKLFPDESKKHSALYLAKVLGDSTSPLKDALSAIPFYFWLTLGLELLFLFIVGVAIQLVYQAWAEGALLVASQDAIDEKTPTIHAASEQAFPRIKSLLWIRIVPSFVIGLITAAALALFGGLVFFAPAPIKIFAGIVSFLVILAVFVVSALIAATLVWAPRKIMFEKQSAREAFWQGLRIARKKFWSMLLLGIVNNLVTGIAMFAVIIIPVILVILLVIATAFIINNNIVLGSILAVVIATLIVGILIAATVGNGIVSAFKTLVWNLAFKKIQGKYDK